MADGQHDEFEIARRKLLQSGALAGGVGGFGLGVGSARMSQAASADFRASTATEGGTGIIESFEDGDLSEYESQNTSIGNSGFSVEQNESEAFHGEYYLKTTADRNTHIYSKTEDDQRSISRGDVFEVAHYVPQGQVAPFKWCFGVQGSESTHYSLRVRSGQDDLILEKRIDGRIRKLASTSAAVPAAEWSYSRVDFDSAGDGTIEVTLHDTDDREVATVSATDTEFDSGPIAFASGASKFVGTRFDGIQRSQTQSVEPSRSVFVHQEGMDPVEITPFSVEGTDVEEFYAYDESGKTSANTGLEAGDTSQLFFYEHPDSGELSMVVVHDDKDHGDGGSATFGFSPGLPSGGAWDVQDDEDHTADEFGRKRAEWKWASCCTDGGAYRGGFEEGFEFEVEASFSGVETWQVLSGDDDGTPVELRTDESIILSIDEKSDFAEVRPLVEEKSKKIETIRNVATPHLFIDESEVDTKADEFVDATEKKYLGSDPKSPTQLSEGLHRLNQAEVITRSATKHMSNVLSFSAKAAVEFGLPLAIFKIFGKVKRGIPLVDDSISEIKSLLKEGRDLALGISNLPHTVLTDVQDFFNTTFVSKVANAIDDNREALTNVGATALDDGIEAAVKTITGKLLEEFAGLVETLSRELTKIVFSSYYSLDDPTPKPFGVVDNNCDLSLSVGPTDVDINLGINPTIDKRVGHVKESISRRTLSSTNRAERGQTSRNVRSCIEKKGEDARQHLNLLDTATSVGDLLTVVLVALAAIFVLAAFASGAEPISSAGSFGMAVALADLATKIALLVATLRGAAALTGINFSRFVRAAHARGTEEVVAFEEYN